MDGAGPAPSRDGGAAAACSPAAAGASRSKRVVAEEGVAPTAPASCGGSATPAKRHLSSLARPANSARKLMRRELDARGNAAFRRHNAAEEKFRNLSLAYEYDTHDPGTSTLVLPFLKSRSKVVEIVSAKDVVFVLAHSGVCAAFSRESGERLCFLNIGHDEVVRSLFYNKYNHSIVTVSVYASDNFSSLRCRTTPVEYVRRGEPDQGFPLFESESLRWPGFVEFDDVNAKVLTYSAQNRVYKVYDLKNYKLQYSVSDKNVQEIKISPGVMLLIFERKDSHVALKILSIETGEVLKSFNHLLHRSKKVDFIEQFNEILLVKQEKENLQLLNVRSGSLLEVGRKEFRTPSAFIFLYENQLFLTFYRRTVSVWNFRGELVTQFKDHMLWYPDCNTNNIYITNEQDLIISYCRSTDADNPSVHTGTINVSNILTGKCVAKVLGQPSCVEGEQVAPNALEDVTALYYDEERNEIFTGNRHGRVHVWA